MLVATYDETQSVQIADDGTWTPTQGEIILVSSDKAFEYNYGGSVYFSLDADTIYLIESATDPTFHAPSGGGTVTLTYSTGNYV